MPADSHPLVDGWEVAAAEPGADPADWVPARVPGTAAGAWRDAGRWRLGDELDFDAFDWWFRTSFDGGRWRTLRLGGLATLADVWLNGTHVLASESMFLEHELDVAALLGERNELAIRCRALGPELATLRGPRARWRTKLADGRLRLVRTTLFGRAPGFAPGPAPVGPWRGVALAGGPGADVSLRPRLDGKDGVLAVQVRGAGAARLEVEAGGRRLVLGREGAGELRLPDAERWWPHTHGEPVLHDVRVLADGVEIAARRIGFRRLEPGLEYDVERATLGLAVNGVEVFARGAVWTPLDPVGLAPDTDELRAALLQVREAGLNMLRVVGTSAYESAVFHDLCDELGVLVWQDFMFANFDYPVGDDVFRALVDREARQVLRGLAGRPSLAVLCGNSEVEQQVAMLGLDPSLGRGELFGELLPSLAREAGADVPYVPSAPCGGELPMRPDRGVAHYFGVGGYRRPLGDARRAAVGFAAECLALSNVPDDGDLGGVPGDVGADWDFGDVRDHYLRDLYGLDPEGLRKNDPARYLAIGRAVTGEVMAEVLGEWRRPASPCRGGIVLWLRDVVPGSGWGVVDSGGRPKLSYHHLRRILAPVAIWTTDEGMAGIDVHVANDGPEPLEARIRVALYRDLELRVGEATEEIRLGPHAALTRSVEGVLGRFVDAAWSYRFGPPAHDVVVLSLERDEELLAQSFRLVARTPPSVPDDLGLAAALVASGIDTAELELSTRRLAYGVRVAADGWTPSDDGFAIEPGCRRRVSLRPQGTSPLGDVHVTALNLAGGIVVA